MKYFLNIICIILGLIGYSQVELVDSKIGYLLIEVVDLEFGNSLYDYSITVRSETDTVIYDITIDDPSIILLKLDTTGCLEIKIEKENYGIIYTSICSSKSSRSKFRFVFFPSDLSQRRINRLRKKNFKQYEDLTLFEKYASSNRSISGVRISKDESLILFDESYDLKKMNNMNYPSKF